MQNFFEIFHENNGTAVALGFFDGLHRGHRNVISSAVNEKENGLTAVCLTFLQSPKSVLTNTESNALMTDSDKLKMLEALGIDHTIQADFRQIMDMSAQSFFKDILIDKLNAKKLFCGFNYHFGKNGEGDVQLLKELCDKHNVELTVVPPEENDGEVVSSTLIRKLISAGSVRKANELLCSEFGFCSIVEHGKKLGRTLGTPTINQPLLKELAVPKFGVYASRVTLEDGKSYCGVTNIGIKPTVGGSVPVCETWMPQYDGGEIYGQAVDIRLLEFIREEKKFADIEELKNAILENGKTALNIYYKLTSHR